MNNLDTGSLFPINSSGHVQLSGRLDVSTIPAIWNNRKQLMSLSQQQMTIDLSDVSHCDSSGIAFLIQIRNEANLQHKSIMFVSPTSQITKLIQLNHLEDIVTIQ